MSEKIKVMLVDDEQLIRSGLKIMLETYPDIEVIHQAGNGREAFECCKIEVPDVVLMDIRMPVSTGIEGTKLIKEAYPEVKIVMVTTFQDTEYIVEAMQYGASGYLLKDSSYEAIYDGIKVALSGKVVMDATVSEKLVMQPKAPTTIEKTDISSFGLTEREIELIRLVSQGLNNKEISEALFLSEGTVKNNISTILSKLALRDRTQLVIFAYDHHIR
ncbi:response regulator [Granulicatella elegans]|jgi:DNA-binding response regulator|uniref:response regulator n=1 Tax=Granulicatella elegans TaxID=137732 RepID=UPI0003001D5F|nr:response regulator transcription factor [Granulicatella elegans]RKW29179.1 MAG: DNA-binding response regulator [Granulicatella sp.]